MSPCVAALGAVRAVRAVIGASQVLTGVYRGARCNLNSRDGDLDEVQTGLLLPTLNHNNICLASTATCRNAASSLARVRVRTRTDLDPMPQPRPLDDSSPRRCFLAYQRQDPRDWQAIESSVSAGYMPIITSMAEGVDGHLLHVNADVAAADLARALKPLKVVYLSEKGAFLTAKTR